jgi:hypothetical protein
MTFARSEPGLCAWRLVTRSGAGGRKVLKFQVRPAWVRDAVWYSDELFASPRIPRFNDIDGRALSVWYVCIG